MIAQMDITLALLLAVLLDAAIGDPGWLYRRVPHPVVLIGRMIEAIEARLWRPDLSSRALKRRGCLAVMLVSLVSIIAGIALQRLCLAIPGGWVLLGMAMSTLIAQRSLAQHVDRVAVGLDQGLVEGRAAVSMIVGRDPKMLDRPAVARAAIESTAENFSDGIIAPLLFAAIAGLPGLMLYKAVNTLDSMIGHKNERYRHFGRFAAKLDDLANLIPARLAGLSLVLAASSLAPERMAGAWQVMVQDAHRHRSPNAGWPEAAAAGALGVRLGGPRHYGDERIEDAWLGDGRTAATAADIRTGLALIWRAWLIWFAILGAVGLSFGLA